MKLICILLGALGISEVCLHLANKPECSEYGYEHIIAFANLLWSNLGGFWGYSQKG